MIVESKYAEIVGTDGHAAGNLPRSLNNTRRSKS